jgi:hypothetical protein
VIEAQEHETPRLATGEPEEGLEGEPSRPDLAGRRREGVGGVILRGAAVLLNLLAWWPEAASAGHSCVAALQVRQGTGRE